MSEVGERKALFPDADRPAPGADCDSAPHPCQRCGSDEWEYVDYGGCSGCRPYVEREEVAAWVAWALTTPLRHGLTTFGRVA